jgi:hypothetical protein
MLLSKFLVKHRKWNLGCYTQDASEDSEAPEPSK